MSKLVAVVGDTGVGKSSSIKHLSPSETYVINVAGKELPFKGSEKLYNADLKNYCVLDTPKEVLEKIEKIATKAPHIKNIVVEDANYLMGFMMVDKATETGYTKFSVMAQQMKNLVQGIKNFREDLVIFYFSHPEEVEDSGEIVTYKMKTAGKLVDKELKLDGLFTTVLYAIVEGKENKPEYIFLTNRYKKYPAKTPMGMFDELKVPNDLQMVRDKVIEYYS